MYRYLLARNIGQSFNDNGSLNIDWCTYIIRKIVELRNQHLSDNNDNNEIKSKANPIPKDVQDISDISDKLKFSTQKIIDIVAPY
ncbi:hypothetical protein CSC82_30375 [Rhodobacteraceae bacterium 4F10]|nr:hypothetical protein CSC82_30375 [Rhodobacteraceae bacterium 4F10]